MLRLKLQERAAIAAAQAPEPVENDAEPRQTNVPDVAYGAPTDAQPNDLKAKLLDFEPTESYL